MRIMRTNYKIDTFQESFFVTRNLRELFDATAPDFTPYYEAGSSPPLTGNLLRRCGPALSNIDTE
jgi:phenylalanine-4-hydroxylase